MRGLRLLAVLGVCALACAKRPMMDAAAPPDGLQAEPGATEAEAPATASPEQAEPEPPRAATSDAPASLEEMTATLDQLEGELRAEGVRLRTYRKSEIAPDGPAKRVTGKPPSPTPSTKGGAAGTQPDPCARICGIATAVCGLEANICALADEHHDEPRYAAACKRATRDCARATEACDDCR